MITRAINAIDEEFGEGYAREHPELVGAYMQAAAINGVTGALQFVNETLSDANEQLSKAAGVLDLSDAVAELSSNLYQGLHEIAHAFTCGTEISLTGLSEVANAIDPTGKHQQHLAQFYKADEEELAKRKANGAVGKDGGA